MNITYTHRSEQTHCSIHHRNERPKRPTPARQALQDKTLAGAQRLGPQAPPDGEPPAPQQEKKRKAAETERPKPAHKGPGRELQLSIEALKRYNDQLRRKLDGSEKREKRARATWLTRLQDVAVQADQKLAATVSALSSSASAQGAAHKLTVANLEERMKTITKVQKTAEDELERAKAEVRVLTIQKAALEVDVTCIHCENERRCVQLLPCNHIPFCRTCYTTYCAAKQRDAIGGLVCPTCNGVCRGCVTVFL